MNKRTKNAHLSLQTKYARLILLLNIIIMALASCNKEDSEEDILLKGMANLTQSYVQKASEITFNNENYIFNDEYKGIPITLETSSKNDGEIQAVIDESLITSYNNLFGESYPSIASKSFSVNNNGKFSIKSGQSQTSDSLFVQLQDASSLKDSTVYLVPVRLSSIGKMQLKTSVIFFKVYVFKTRLYSSIVGGSVPDYSVPSLGPQGYYFFLPLMQSEFLSSQEYKLRVPVSLSRIFPKNDVHIKARVYSSDEIAQNYGNNFGFPDGTIAVDKDVVTVEAGKLQSSENLEVSIINRDRFEIFKTYTMVLQLEKDMTDPLSVDPSTDPTSTIYITFLLF